MALTSDQIDDLIAALLAERRSDCDCAPYRKPCTTCDAYWDGLIEMNEALQNGSEAPS